MSLRKNQLALFFCLFFLSGAAGLIYEIVWSRMLVLVFGGTTFAITTVLACFMGGLALGSFLVGRFASRLGRPERAYGWLEIAIGLFCLLIPFLLQLATPLYRALAPLTGGSFVLLTATRVVVSSLILLVPTCIMGATLPILVQGFARGRDDPGGRIAGLYGINTAGAFAGCVAAGFLLIPWVGLRSSIWIAAAINIGIGLAALAWSRSADPAQGPKPARTAKAEARARDRNDGPTLPAGVLLTLYAISGFAAMAYQVAWTRALILAMGSSTYAFSAIVACYILGLAVGSLTISWGESRPSLSPLLGRKTLWIAGWLQAVIALSALLVVPLLGRMPIWVGRLVRGPQATFAQVLGVETLIVSGLLIVPTLCMGALMPLVCRLYSRNSSAGRSVGYVYAANTLGTIVGAFTAGFVLIPLESIGMQQTIHVASGLSAAVGSVFLLASTGRSLRAWVAVGLIWVVGGTTVALGGPWAREVMISGPYEARQKDFQQSVLYYREGVDSTVAVVSVGGKTRTLKVNGKPDASTGYEDMVTQRMVGHVPMLLTWDAEDVLVIGLGSGVTAGAVLSYPVQRVDIAEISSAVIESSAFFDEVNNGVRDDPRITVHRNDGRNHLLLTERMYDVIISQPSNPWISGVANLFTREFFELARSRLRPGGLHCQWIQGYSIRAEDLAAILKTLGDVFPHIQLWQGGFNDHIAIGSEAPIEIDLDRIYEAMARPDVTRSLGQLLILDPNQIAAHWVADRPDLEPWIAPQRILTDDHPDLEFSASRFLLDSDEERIRDALLAFRHPPRMVSTAPPILIDEFLSAADGGRQVQRALKQLEGAATARDGDATLDGLLEVARWGATDPRALNLVDRLLKLIEAEENPTLEQRVRETRERLRGESSYLRSRRGRATEELFWPFIRRFEHDGDPQVERLDAEVRRGIAERDGPLVLESVGRLRERAPDSWRGLAILGELLFESEGPDRARPHLLRAWVRNPNSRTVSYRLAHVYARMSEPELALAFLRGAIDNGTPVATIAADPGFAPLREDPRFRALLDESR